MKLSNKIGAFIFSALLVFSTLGCKYDLVDAPTRNENNTKNAADYADYIQPPETVTASHGGYRNVNLSWSKVDNAVQYQIFSSVTPFDSFIQIAETTGTENSMDIEEEPGVTVYYAVCAVNYYGTISSKSQIVKGSTLSIPIITDISSNDSGDALSVTWWMDNCSEDTYENSVQFVLTAYDSSKNAIEDAEVIVEGSERTATIENLTPKTDYYFVVEAQILNEDGEVDEDQKSEKSDYTSASTTHNVTPPCAVDVSADQGKSTSEILVSWTLPEGADFYDSASSSYVIHPVYFVIQRKAYSASTPAATPSLDDSSFTTIKTIGLYDIPTVSVNDNEKRNSSNTIELTFDCSDGKTYTSSGADAADLLTVTNSGTALEEYSKYKAGAKLTFHDKDSNLHRGTKYVYRIISYTDDTSRKIVATSSISEEVKGWKLDYANFVTSKEYTLNTGSTTNIKNFKVSFETDFDAMGISYKYVIKEKVTAQGASDGITSTIKTLSSVSEVNSYERVIETSNQNIAKYEYTLEIQNSSGTVLITQKSIGSILVVANTSDLPTLEYMEIEDGYNSKFKVYWNYDSDYTYKITKYLYDNDEDTTAASNKVYDVGTNFVLTDNSASYEIPAETDEIAKFTITAYKNEQYAGEIPDDTKYYSLGTAKITLGTPDYKDITVSWNNVPKATDYSISAVYADNTTKELINDTNSTLTQNNDDSWTFKLSQPEGYNDAAISGKPITLKVKAINQTRGDSTTSNKTVRTLGPQAGNTRITAFDDKSISVTWDKVEGAAGYLVYAVPFNEGNAETLCDYDSDSSEPYFITTNNNSDVTIEGSDKSVSTVYATDTNFTLTDKHLHLSKETAASDRTKYQEKQDKISLGLPFGYCVIPVISKDDVSFASESNLLTIKASNIEYTNTKDALTLGATYGCGLNVTASKAISNTDITVTWDQPYNAGEKNAILYKRKTSTSEEWTSVKTLASSNSNSLSYTVTTTDLNDTNAYDFAVFYNSVDFEGDAVKSYENYLASDNQKDPLSETEASNKGYTLSIPNKKLGFDLESANPVYESKEIFTWTDSTYDFNKRKIGPDFYEIQVKNLNNTKGFVTVAKIKADTPHKAEQAADIKDDTKVKLTSSSNNTAYFQGLFDANKISDGQFKVLRDYKHYYRLVAVRTVDGERVEAVASKDISGNELYGYREISEQELAKCINLIIADALYQTGIPYNGSWVAWSDNTETRTITSNGGSFSISGTVVGAFDYKNKISWSMTSYNHIFPNGTSSSNSQSFNSGFTLNSSSCTEEIGIDSNTLYHLPALTITPTHETNLSSYQKKVQITVGESGNSTKYYLKVYNVTDSKDIIDLPGSSTKAQFEFWFPYNIGNKHQSADTTANTVFPTYNTPWWN